MNIAGPSRAPAGRLDRRERVESTYEDDLIGLLQHLDVNEIEELQTFYARRKRDGYGLSDHDYAMDFLLQHARELTAFQEDRALAQRLATEEMAATPTTQQVRWEAAPPPNDNQTTATTATATATAPTQTQPTGQQRNEAIRNGSENSETWGKWLSSMFGWATAPSSDNTTNTTTLRAPTSNRLTGHTCVICQDPIRGGEVRAPCNHYYDIACITDLFQAATKDETLYPPRCCRMNIPFAEVRPHLSQELLTEFLGKQTEFSTVKRVYCSSPRCSRFLGAASEGIFVTRLYTCPAPACGRRTCGRCREEHSGDRAHVCRPDADAEQVLTLGRASGWARCPGCSQMIELNIGCFHMTCRCRTEFCYLCQAGWKTCRCPQWDEQRLMAAAEARVDAQLGMGQQRGARRYEPVEWARPAPAPVPAPVPAPILAPIRPRALVPAEPARRAPEAMQPVAAPAVPVHSVAAPARPGPSRQAIQATPVTPTTQPLQPRPTPARHTTVTNPSTTSSVRDSGIAQRSAVQAPATGQSGSSSSTVHYVPAPTPEVRSNVSTRTTAVASSSATPSWRIRRDTTPSSKANTDREAVRQVMIREAMDRLRVDHECDHTKWQYRKGSGRCQTCGHDLPFYLFSCQGCEMLACNRCRRNRL